MHQQQPQPTSSMATTEASESEEAAEANEEEEVEWTDDQIRWHEEFQKIKDDREHKQAGRGEDGLKNQLEQHGHENDGEEEDDGDDECAYWDPFKDPDPFETFSFEFTTSLHPSPIEDDVESNENENSINNINSHENNATTSTAITVELRGYKTGADEVWKSTGVTIWRAAEYLGRFLASRPHYILPPQENNNNNSDNNQQKVQKKHKILELGAGLGLCGILAYRLVLLQQQQLQQQQLQQLREGGGEKAENGSTAAGTTSTVCITDGDTDALKYLRDNIEQNKEFNNNNNNKEKREATPNSNSPPIDDNDNDNGRVQVSGHQLIWGKEASRTFQKRHGSFDVILASDIIYAKCIVEPLWETIQTLLKRNTTTATTSPAPRFIMAYCARRQVDVTIDYVLEHAKGAGFDYKELIPQEDSEQDEGVRVFAFQWKQLRDQQQQQQQ